MGQLIEEAIAGLKDTVALRENANDSIWIAGDLLARFHTNNGFKSGFAHIEAEIVTNEDAERMKQALLDALDKCTTPAPKGSILGALQHVRDPNLIPLYIAHLEESLRLIEGSSCVIYSCLNNLNRLGEDVIPTGINDVEQNWRQARDYIGRLNPTMLMPFPFDRKFPRED